MRERPILFSGPMVRAVLAGTKTQTRRVMRPGGAPVHHERTEGAWRLLPGTRPGWGYVVDGPRGSDIRGGVYPCPYGTPGDRLWVRETWRPIASGDAPGMVRYGAGYRADGAVAWRHGGFPCRVIANDRARLDLLRAAGDEPIRWRPSIHMPRWASRITLEVTGVRVERVQEISSADAWAEGVQCPCTSPLPRCAGNISEFAALWDNINARRPGCSWNNNPWVWVVEFRRVSP